MPHLVRIFCPTCHGESADPSAPYCRGLCHSQGHIDIDRNPDGSVPTHYEGEPVRLWVDSHPIFDAQNGQ